MNYSHEIAGPAISKPLSLLKKTISIRKGLLAAGFVLALSGTQVASAAIITSSLGNTSSGLSDGDMPATFLLGGIQSGQPAPFDQSCGSDLFGNCSASWNFSFGALADPILSASLTIGIVDHDSSATGSQLASFNLDGNDLTSTLDALFEQTGDGLDGMYNVYTVDLSSLFSDLIDGSASVGLDLSGPGLQTCRLPFACPGQSLPFVSETQSNGANLIFSTLTIETQDAQAVPEPGTLALFGLGIVTMGIYRRRRLVQ